MSLGAVGSLPTRGEGGDGRSGWSTFDDTQRLVVVKANLFLEY